MCRFASNLCVDSTVLKETAILHCLRLPEQNSEVSQVLVVIVMVCTEFGKSRKVVELERAFCRYGGKYGRMG